MMLVTGASGFLGAEVVRCALAEGWRVRAFGRHPGTPTPEVELFSGDIRNLSAVREACKGVTSIVHAAGLAHVFRSGIDIERCFQEVNELGTANVAEAAGQAGVCHLVLVSSVSVYGNHSGKECDETTPCRPTGPYAMSKWLAEMRAMERSALDKGSLAILRLATIYGEGDRGNVARLIRLVNSRCFVLPGDGLNRKSLIYKRDAAIACVRAASTAGPGTSVFNVAGAPERMRDIVNAICHALGRPEPSYRIPAKVLEIAIDLTRVGGDPWQIGESFSKFLRDDVYPASKFEAMFRFCAATPILEGISSQLRAAYASKQLVPALVPLQAPTQR